MREFVVLLLSSVITIIAPHCTYIDKHRFKSSSISQSQADLYSINPQGNTIETRFDVPDGFRRVPVIQPSFAAYLRHLPLKATGEKVRYYNGKEKEGDAYIAVISMDIGNRNLQQCADAIMRLRGEYFYQQKKYDSISFTLTNGFKADYTKWMEGNRIAVRGNEAFWVKTATPSNTYQDFRKFMDMVFSYAGTLSLSGAMRSKHIEDLSIGDVFVFGGSPGHAVLVADVAKNADEEKIFILVQSYMPAQEIQVLKNPNDKTISPWYRADFAGDLLTPEWIFTKDQLKTW